MYLYRVTYLEGGGGSAQTRILNKVLDPRVHPSGLDSLFSSLPPPVNSLDPIIDSTWKSQLLPSFPLSGLPQYLLTAELVLFVIPECTTRQNVSPVVAVSPRLFTAALVSSRILECRALCWTLIGGVFPLSNSWQCRFSRPTAGAFFWTFVQMLSVFC